ncbi:histidine kinase N-terminal 7TM domain-containing protein [Peribacillus frigoritolerans]|uniref:histidine kinase N-terminal 7TM domain-containing protein n=1 Tax=Peribacillus frigoritolerans TaxID=450367 RepID=UPI002E1D3F22
MAGALSLFLCLFALLKIKDAPGAKPYIILTLFSSIFTFSYAFELSSTSLEQIIFWLRVEYLALPFIPVFLLLMCIEYIGHSSRRYGNMHSSSYRSSPFSCIIQMILITYITNQCD